MNTCAFLDQERAVKGKHGIFFKGYWQRSAEKGRSGDHIDLWNKNELASAGIVRTFFRQAFPSIAENVFNVSDLRRASEVLFWEMP